MLIVFGSINADLVFQVDTLPGPGETVIGPGYVVVDGGKGANQASAAARTGARPLFVGAVGDDPFAPGLRERLAASGVDVGSLRALDGPSGVAVIGVDHSGENQIIVGSGANARVDAAAIPWERVDRSTTLLVQNELRPQVTFEAIVKAGRLGSRTILNMAPAGPVPAEVLSTLDCLLVNEHEIHEVDGAVGGDLRTVALDLAHRFDLAVVVTLGAAGVLLARAGGVLSVPALPIEPVDTTGAGDCFAGVLAASLDAGLEWESALRRASVAGALACQALGARAGQPDAAAIDAAMERLPASRSS